MSQQNNLKIQKVVTIIFFALLLLDVSRIFFTPTQQQQPTEQQQNQEQQQSQEDVQSEHKQKKEGENNDFDEDEADKEFEKFKENEFDEEKAQRKSQEKRNKKSKKGSGKYKGSYSNPNSVLIQYCHSSKYKQEANWKELVSALQREIEYIDVEGVEFPVDSFKATLSKICSYLQFVVLGLSLFGDRLFGMLGMPYPKWYTIFKEKKMIFIMIGFAASSFLSGYLLQTGAFEIEVNGHLEYSNLGKNGQPELFNIVDIIEKAVQIE